MKLYIDTFECVFYSVKATKVRSDIVKTTNLVIKEYRFLD